MYTGTTVLGVSFQSCNIPCLPVIRPRGFLLLLEPIRNLGHILTVTNPNETYNAGQKLLRKMRKTASYLKPQAIENSFKRAYGEVEDNIIIYIERLKT